MEGPSIALVFELEGELPFYSQWIQVTTTIPSAIVQKDSTE